MVACHLLSIFHRHSLFMFSWTGFAVLLVVLPGCFGGPKRLEAPKFDADGAAKQALSLYDANTDGQLDADELKKCPALAGSLSSIDTGGDGSLDAAEIAARISMFTQSKLSRMSVSCRVVKGGQELVGITVRYIPEPFMGDSIQAAEGVTNEQGMANIHVVNDQENIGGVMPGFYKVELSRMSGNKEIIPKKYNSETILGQEITSGSRELSEGIIYTIK